MLFNENDVHKHLYEVGLETVIEDAEPLLNAALSKLSKEVSEYDIPTFELWRLLKEKAVEKLRSLHRLTLYGEFIGTGINLPVDRTRHMSLDLLGTHEDGLFVLELKIERSAERNAFTELFAYSNYIAGLFPGSGSNDILNILVAPIAAKITKQAYLYDLLISDRNVVLYQPEFPAGTAKSLRLSLYIPDDDDFRHFANRLLSHDAMSCVVASFSDIPGWIDYDKDDPASLPSYTRDTLQKLTSYAAQLMEHEGLHGFCYVRKRWHEVQTAIVGEEPSDLIICALNPFRLIDAERISSVCNQLADQDRARFSEAPQLGFDGRLSRTAKRAIEDCIEAKYSSELEFPYWGAMVTEMVETVFADQIGFRPTGMFRDAYVEHLTATRRYNEAFPDHAIDLERLQVDDITNWSRAWIFMEACGFVAGEAE